MVTGVFSELVHRIRAGIPSQDLPDFDWVVDEKIMNSEMATLSESRSPVISSRVQPDRVSLEVKELL
jgi:hypothetical protein